MRLLSYPCFAWILVWVSLFASIPALAQRPQILVNAGHSQEVTCMDFHPSGKWLATGSADRSIRIWDMEQGRLLKVIPNGNYITGLSYLNRGDTLFVGTKGDYDAIYAALLDAATGDTVKTFAGPAAFDGLQFYKDSRVLLSQHSDGSTSTWITSPEFFLANNYKTPDPQFIDTKICMSGDQNLIAVVMMDTAGVTYLSIMTVDSAGQVSEPQPLILTHMPTACYFTPDNQYLVLEVEQPSGDNLYSLFSMAKNDYEWDITGTSLCMDASRKWLIYHHSTGVVACWDWENDRLVQQSSEYYPTLTALTVYPEGGMLAGAGQEGDLYFWNLDSLKPIKHIESIAGLNAVAVHPDGETITFNGKYGDIHHLNLPSGQIRTHLAQEGQVSQIAYSADGRYYATAGQDSVVRCYLTARDSFLWGYVLPDNRFYPISFGDHDRFISLTTGTWQYMFGTTTGDIFLEEQYGSDTEFSALSQDGKYSIAVVGYELAIVPLDTSKPTNTVVVPDGYISTVAYDPDGEHIWVGTTVDSLFQYNLENPGSGRGFYTYNYPTSSISISSDGKFLASGHDFGMVLVWDLEGDSLYTWYQFHSDRVTSTTFLQDKTKLLSTSLDGRIVIYDLANKALIGELFIFPNGEWAITDPSGRFDADPTIMQSLHMVVGKEIIDLEQIKHRYYEPGILPKLMGFDDTPIRQVNQLDDIPLAPETAIVLDKGKLIISVRERSGGLGKLHVYINHKLLVEDCTPFLTDRSGSSTTYAVPLTPYLGHAFNDRANIVRVRSYNQEGWLFNRSDTVHWQPKEKVADEPGPDHSTGSIYILSIGVRDYAGDDIDLTYTAQDAVMMAKALKLGGRELAVDSNRVHVKILTTDPDLTYPSRQNILEAFEWLKQAKAQDIVVVFFSGHGISFKDEFYLMAAEATTLDPLQLSDLANLRTMSISSTELSNALNDIYSGKKLLIMDACASGRGAANISTTLYASKSSIAPSTLRSWDRMNDRSGTFILAGSADDAESFESNAYGQSLLTYALLKGMRGEATRKDSGEEYVDVLQWFGFAREEVVTLAQGIGKIQAPRIFPVGAAESFDIARVDQVKHQIPINKEKPIFGPAQFTFMQDGFPGDDREALNLTKLFNATLDDFVLSAKGKAPFVFTRAADFPDAIKIVGTYTISEGTATVNILLKKAQASKTFQVVLDTTDKEGMIHTLLNECISRL